MENEHFSLLLRFLLGVFVVIVSCRILVVQLLHLSLKPNI